MENKLVNLWGNFYVYLIYICFYIIYLYFIYLFIDIIYITYIICVENNWWRLHTSRYIDRQT